jgi:hypothetical protein
MCRIGIPGSIVAAPSRDSGVGLRAFLHDCLVETGPNAVGVAVSPAIPAPQVKAAPELPAGRAGYRSLGLDNRRGRLRWATKMKPQNPAKPRPHVARTSSITLILLSSPVRIMQPQTSYAAGSVQDSD